MTPAQLRAMVGRVLAMAEPRCTCGHVLTQHSRRRLLCFGRYPPPWVRLPGCGCQGWTPAPRGP